MSYNNDQCNTPKQMFHFASILNSELPCMINMLKKLTFYFNFLVKLLRTLVSPYFQLHREVSFFTGRGDPENWGIRYVLLDQKGE